MKPKSFSNLMAPPLLGGEPSSRRSGYSAIPSAAMAPRSLPTPTAAASAGATASGPIHTVEEAALALRDRLPGRSKKAKDQFRRQQRGEKGDQWRGRLSGYCPSDSLDCEKVTKHLKDQLVNSQNLFFTSALYTRKWRVKAHFDVLHLHSFATKAQPMPNTGAAAAAAAASGNADESLLAGNNNTGFESTGYYDTEDEFVHQERRLQRQDSPGVDDEGRDFSRLNTHANTSADAGAAASGMDEEELDIFLFGFGPVVFWGFPNEQAERDVLKDLVSFVDGEWHDPVAAESAREEMEFVTSRGDDTHSERSGFGLGVVNDLIELTAQHSSGGTSRSKPAAEKLSISSAIAQSCHLSIYESRLSETISRYSHIPKKLAEEGKIDMTGDEISREIGRLFVERNLINLEPELLDTPEFLWNDREFEPVYKNVYRYLEVEPRIEVLNKRLSIVGELLEVLKSQQEHQHANHLEFIVVVLISMEVVLQVVWNILLKDILGWVGQPGGDY